MIDGNELDFLCLSETFGVNREIPVTYSVFKFVARDRGLTNRGGVAIMIRNNFNYTRLDSLYPDFMSMCERAGVEVTFVTI